ncbi:MAG: hypothetical protein FD141_376 [Fusobacteria bacterium]|nr:MAG: hypothetical protein FD141_376 [Fusobacteriota bacterium]KAF0228959.1 MAG: hypothetical protein FD182_1215 [Fusobacteriota bacterium]
MSKEDKLTSEQLEDVSKELQRLSSSAGITTEEAIIRADALGQSIDKYYKDHPEEYQALLRRIPSLNRDMEIFIESIKDLVNVIIELFRPLIEVMINKLNKVFSYKKNKKNNKRIHRIKRKLTRR